MKSKRMKSTGVVAIVAAGLIAVNEVVPDKRQPHWMDSYHSHVEFPEGTTSHGSQMAFDSSVMTNTANTASVLGFPYIAISR
jgi:hypothetical protein